MGGADKKVIIERLCISLPYVETFNSKVIKGFIPELRSRYVFFVFRDSYVLCIYVMNILCTFHISISGYVTQAANGLTSHIDFIHSPSQLQIWYARFPWINKWLTSLGPFQLQFWDMAYLWMNDFLNDHKILLTWFLWFSL